MTSKAVDAEHRKNAKVREGRSRTARSLNVKERSAKRRNIRKRNGWRGNVRSKRTRRRSDKSVNKRPTHKRPVDVSEKKLENERLEMSEYDNWHGACARKGSVEHASKLKKRR